MSYALHEPYDITRDGQLTIGDNCNIRPFVSIVCKHKITIGEGTQIGPGVRIVDFDHDMETLDAIDRVGLCQEVSIGRKCWIGANAVILKGVTLGDYCVVGAGAVVTDSFPERSVIVGNPGRRIKIR